MEKKVTNNTALSVRILYWDIRIHSCFSNFYPYLQTLLEYASTKWKVWTKMANLRTETLNQQFCIGEKGEEEKLSGKNVERVMEVLGLDYDPDGEEIQERIGAHELSELFEDGPSLDEVKDAFDVFDANKDGFIDAKELRKVLRDLGLEDGSEVEECRNMIKAVDENGDGLIDFGEFVKFMEKSFC